MNDAEQETNHSHFHFSHLAIIILCVFLLFGITFMKSGFDLSIFKIKTAASDSPVKQYTFEQAQADVIAEMGGSFGDGSENENKNQIAMLDPTSAPQVLGASTENGDGVFPSAEEVLTPEVLAGIQVILNGPATEDSVKEYKLLIQAVESDNQAENIFVALSSDDPKILTEASKNVEPLIKAMLATPVPNELAELHKVKMIYYMLLSELADGYAGVPGVTDPKDTGIHIFSIVDRMQRLTQELSTKYGVDL